MNIKQKLKTNYFLFLPVIIIAFTSCLNNVDEEIVVEEPIAEVTFSLDVQPIIASNCLQCHSTAGGTSPNLETYAGVSTNAARIKAEVVSKRMPIGGGSLTDDEILAISTWVDAGAKNN